MKLDPFNAQYNIKYLSYILPKKNATEEEMADVVALTEKVEKASTFYANKGIAVKVGSRELVNNDYEYAMWIYRHCGNIDTSKVVLEGSLVRVVDGPLLDGIGTIVRIDRHKRRAWVEFDFNGKKQSVSLSIEDVTSYVD